MRHTVICGLSCCTIFFPHYLINGTILGKKLLNVKCVLIFGTFCSKHFKFLKKNWPRCDNKYTYFGLHVKYCYSCCLILIKFEFSGQILEKYSDIIFHENASSGSRFPGGRTHVTNLIVAFRSFANALNNYNTVKLKLYYIERFSVYYELLFVLLSACVGRIFCLKECTRYGWYTYRWHE
jgi:hypothetical protein